MAFNPREFLTAFATALNSRDFETLETLIHPDFTTWIPQSGEKSHGFEGFVTQLKMYPGGAPQMPDGPQARLVGDDDRWAITPAYTVVPLTAPNEFTLLGHTIYPDGRTWHVVTLVEIRDEKLYRMENYFAPELAAPLPEAIANYRHG